MDLETRTRLGLCTAVRVKDVLVLLFEDGMGQHSLTKSTIEAEMLVTDTVISHYSLLMMMSPCNATSCLMI